MRISAWCACASFLVASTAGLVACTGDDDIVEARPASDAGSSFDATIGDAGVDSAAEAEAGPPPPTRVLVTMNNGATSELVVLDPTSLAVQGRLTFPGFIGATASAGDSDPYLLMQSADIVAKLDRQEPWKVKSTWSVRLDDRPDGGYAYADPAAAVVVGSKAYVPRYTRNALAVLDVTQIADAGAPVKTIDLSALRDPLDTDGIVDMTAAIYVPSKNRVFLLLGNVDRNKVVNNGFNILCTASKPNLVAIDPTTDQVTSLGGTGAGGGIALSGYNPVLGAAMIYEPSRDRILVLHAGCNVPDADGGAGPMSRRVVEAIDLASKSTSVALDLDANDFPSTLVPFGSGKAVVGFFADARLWDTSSASLGAHIAGAPDLFAYDGKGALVGPAMITVGDAGTSFEMRRIAVGDAGAVEGGSTIAPNPFTDPSGFPGGVEVWPTP